MIYLIDHQNNRQEVRYGIYQDFFQKNKDVICPFFGLETKDYPSFFDKKEASCILFHTSFPDQGLLKYLKRRFKNIPFVFFSNQHVIVEFENDKIINKISSDTVYQNLMVFVADCTQGNMNLQLLAFGENYQLEEMLKYKENLYFQLFLKPLNDAFTLDLISIEVFEKFHKIAYPNNEFEAYCNQFKSQEYTIEQFLNELDKLSKKIINRYG